MIFETCHLLDILDLYFQNFQFFGGECAPPSPAHRRKTPLTTGEKSFHILY